MVGILVNWERHNCESGVDKAKNSTVFIGAFIGFWTNFHQDRLYRRAAFRHSGKAPPEGRLYHAAVGGLCFSIGMFMFAWTGRPHIHWVVPSLALVLAYWGVHALYSGVLWVHLLMSAVPRRRI